MKEHALQVFAQKSLSLVALVFGYAPVFALIAAFAMPETVFIALWQAVLILPFGVVQFALKGRARSVFAPLSAVLYALCCIVIMPAGTGLLGYVPVLAGCVLLIITPGAAKAPIGSEWSIGLWAGALLVGLFAQLLLRARGLAERGQVSAVSQVLVYLYVVYLFLMLMNLNHLSMNKGIVSKGQEGISASMTRRNRGSVVLLFLVAIVISMWSVLADWLRQGWEGLMKLLAFVLSLIPMRRDEGILQEEGVMSIDPGTGDMEVVAKSAFAAFLEKVFIFIGYAAAAVLAVIAVYFIGKKLWKLCKWLGGRFRNYMNRAAEDYVDETENIFDAEEVKKLLGDKVKEVFSRKRKPKPPRWQDLDGRGKVRYLYRCFYERHPKVQHLTAQEALLSDDTISKNVSVPFAKLYDKARYSDHPIDAKEAEIWKEKLKY